MIFSVILRYYKSYTGNSYIPISNSESFSALIGENGVGKTTVLEAMDSFFNGREWPLNHSVRDKGIKRREPGVCVVFLIEKDKLKVGYPFEEMNAVSELLWECSSSDFGNNKSPAIQSFIQHRDSVKKGYGINKHDYYLIPCGLKKVNDKKKEFELSVSVFESMPELKAIFPKKDRELEVESNQGGSTFEYDKEEHKKFLKKLKDQLVKRYSYVYIPAEVDYDDYTKIEKETVQAIMGQKIESVVKKSVKEEDIKKINKDLDVFLEQFDFAEIGYEYKKPTLRQERFNVSHLTRGVIDVYFGSKVLNKIDGSYMTPISDLSSGEKRKSLIDIIKIFASQGFRNVSSELVLAIDEPEMSLHASACFSQFNKIQEIALTGVQTVISTHWYGFSPVISKGAAVYLSDNGSHTESNLLDLRCFRDEIKALKRASKGRLPVEIQLKSINDLVQSVMSSISTDEYKWIFCEGVSDKVYIESFLGIYNPDVLDQVFILPMGGAPNVKRLYSYLYMAINENSDSISGRVLLLLDTDKQFEMISLHGRLKKLDFLRLQNDSATGTTKLRGVDDNKYNPPTVIEDVLDPLLFRDIIVEYCKDEEFSLNNPEISNDLLSAFERAVISEDDHSLPSGLAFNFGYKELDKIESFFRIEGMKVKFSLEYKKRNDSRVPDWFDEVMKKLEISKKE